MAKYLDLAGPVKSVTFASPPERPDRNMEETREGFLMCRNVTLARTGSQAYMSWEVPKVEPDATGRVTATRDEAEVFHPDAVASFDGKPFTNDHPLDDVTPDNFKDHICGTIMNPRRGVGDKSNHLVGDIIVYDKRAIRDIRSGKREVSCGYDADYERVSPGHGRQVNIRGNHVSLVDAGRCGPACAIKDRSLRDMTKNWKSGFIDGIIAAITSSGGDKEAMAQSLTKAVDSLPDELVGAEPGKGGKTHDHAPTGDTVDKDGRVVLNLNLGGGKHRDDDTTGAGDTPPPPPPSDDEDKPVTQATLMEALTEALQPLADSLTALGARVDKIEGHVEDVTDPQDTQTQDAVSRAESLLPGFKVPNFDAKPGSRAQRDALLGMKRVVLRDALADPKASTHVRPFVTSARPDFTKMTPGEVDVIFLASTKSARDSMSGTMETFSRLPTFKDKDGATKVVDNKTLNERNRDYWKNRGAA